MTPPMTQPKITMYTRPGCADSVRTTQDLQQRGLTWTEINIDEDQEANAKVVGWVGRAATPTLFIGDTLLVEPFAPELDAALAKAR